MSLRTMLNKKAVWLGLATFAVVAGSAFGFSAKKVIATDCSPNAIMHCGTTSASDFISKVKSNNGGTQTDLSKIYADYGLTSANYNRFATTAKAGVAYKDGTIVVGGKVVAQNAQSIGRSQKSYAHQITVGGVKVWESRAQDVFNSNSINVMAYFNDNNDFQFAVMYDCGNVTVGSPTYACNSLTQKQVDRDTFQFTTSASATNEASIDHVVYNFGDGKTQVAGLHDTVTHNYATAGTFKASVTIYVKLPGGKSTTIAAVGNCVKTVTVKPAPVAACTLLTVAGLSRTSYRMSAKATASNGATISGYEFHVRNLAGTKDLQVKTVKTTATSATADFSVTDATSYSTQVYAITSVGKVTSADCMKNFTVAPAPYAVCDLLTITPTSSRTAFTFAAKAHVANGATITGYHFYVRDSTGKKVIDDKSVTTSAAQTSIVYGSDNNPAGPYSAQVYVVTNIGTFSSAACMKNFTVKPAPAVACTNLTSTISNRTNVVLAATASATNGATISSYHFVVNDAAGKLVSAPVVNTTAQTANTGSITLPAGAYTAQVTVVTSLGNVSSAACKTSFTINAAPAAACTSLTASPLGANSYSLTAKATATNGATISSYHFVVTDASGKTVSAPNVNTNALTATTGAITLAQPGTYNAQVTLVTNQGVISSPYCKTTITVKAAPAAACTDLTASAVDRLNYNLTATASATNGATIQGYDFTVKNAAGQTVTTKSVANTTGTATTQVSVTDAGTYTATVNVRTSEGIKNGAQCATSFTVAPLPPSIKITKHVDNVKQETVKIGANFTYELVVTNDGKIDLHNAVVSDPAPEGVTMVSADQGTITNNAWSFTIPTLKVGQSVSFNIVAKVTENHTAPMVNQACVNTPEVNPGTPDQPDDCDTATVTVTPPTPQNPNITIVKTVDGQKSEVVKVGNSYTYKVVVTNTGEIDLKDVAVNDTPQAGVTLLTADLGTLTNNTWNYTIPSLKIGESATFNFTAKVDAYVAGALVNTACVNAVEVNPTQPDQNDSCDTATVTVTPPVTPPTELPNTGVGNVVGIFAATVIASAIGYRFVLSRKLSR